MISSINSHILVCNRVQVAMHDASTYKLILHSFLAATTEIIASVGATCNCLAIQPQQGRLEFSRIHTPRAYRTLCTCMSNRNHRFSDFCGATTNSYFILYCTCACAWWIIANMYTRVGILQMFIVKVGKMPWFYYGKILHDFSLGLIMGRFYVTSATI